MKDNTTKRISVVILNWNGAKLLEEFLPSVITYTPAEIAEIVVADNGSTDNSLEILKDKFPTVRIIPFTTNYGFAEGYNQALNHIDSEYTVLLNSDVEVTSGWLDALITVLDSDNSIACAQPKIRSQRNKEYFEYAGAAGGYLDIYGYPFCRGRVLHIIEKDQGQYDTTTDILWATGACLFVRTQTYKDVGGLDAQFFAHQEEVDMCWRLRCRGYRLVCIPQSIVYHVGGATLNMESPQKTFLNFRNNLLMLYKNLPEDKIRHVMRVRFWLDYIAATKFLLSGHPKNAKAVYDARKEFFSLKNSYLSIRKENLKKTILKKIPELMQQSLILQFYLKGKKTYHQLVD
ncbi:glycosyltransferase family 2 protein [Parabacteroides bouchesdurhonensis]|uniref:glycosyltransferase family 2 protein n=1 Tax=Parabacteroides bouchesdurhonensis TaxID=1936995 RepID=UPI000C8261D4|nr:glycosyltransferase family 2 protein [Parabacteroides bouchesdurhonensis]